MNQPVRRTTLQELDETDGLQGLTSRQYRFAVACFSGLSDADAYRKAYNCEGMTDASVYSASALLAKHPLVNAKLKELRLKVDSQTTLAPYLTRELVINGILSLATTATKESVRLNAYIALGKTVGIDLFREVHVTERVTRTPEDVDKELLDHINRLKPVLEGKAVDVTPGAKEGGTRADRRRKPND
jgi:hypothetical protein